MEVCYETMAVIKAMAVHGNPNSVSDAGVGALCARSGVIGAYLNVKINAAGIKDDPFAIAALDKAEKIVGLAQKEEEIILAIVNEKIV